MPVDGRQECQQNDCDTLNFAWMGFNSAPGMHLPWIDPGKLNSVKCCHFAANASPKMQKCPLMVDRNAIKMAVTRSISRPPPSILHRGKCQPKNAKMPVDGRQECHQNDCDTLNFAWMGFNSAPGMHLPWIDPGKLNSAKCCHFAANASPKMQKCPLMVDRNAIKMAVTRSISCPPPSILHRGKCQPKNAKMPVDGRQECQQNDCDTLNFAWMGFNSAPGMHLPWIDPGKLNSVKCCHFAANASPKMQKCPLMVLQLHRLNGLPTCPSRLPVIVS
ncbi:hypothetical protein C8J57DRAFT_1238818 [Mycena rebaudengoi]|nr:hypothetical protein C8J57DRAFT_1238818 [Mycena rebaudengoi]